MLDEIMSHYSSIICIPKISSMIHTYRFMRELGLRRAKKFMSVVFSDWVHQFYLRTPLSNPQTLNPVKISLIHLELLRTCRRQLDWLSYFDKRSTGNRKSLNLHITVMYPMYTAK